MPSDMNKEIKLTLVDLFKLFVKLGFIAFGGPAAHIAMLQDEVVDKRKWMDREYFLDMMGLTNLIPGPNSTEMVMHCGFHMRGPLGMIVAGMSFIFPAVLLTTLLAFLYVNYGQLPEIAPFLTGIKPAVLALIGAAIFKLGKKAVKKNVYYIPGCIVVILALFGISEVLLILFSGFLFVAIMGRISGMALLVPQLGITGASIATNSEITNTGIFLVFLKIGAILFGSGYVLVAYVDAILVDDLAWLTRRELLDAIAIGQFTPGPVLSSASFIGYQLNAWQGAVWATLGIFTPSFIFVWILHPFIDRIRNSKKLRLFIDGVNIGAVAVMLSVLIDMTYELCADWKTIVIALVAAFFTFGKFKLNAVKLVLLGALLGYALSFVG